jgi:hypothetical protein
VRREEVHPQPKHVTLKVGSLGGANADQHAIWNIDDDMRRDPLRRIPWT